MLHAITVIIMYNHFLFTDLGVSLFFSILIHPLVYVNFSVASDGHDRSGSRCFRLRFLFQRTPILLPFAS